MSALADGTLGEIAERAFFQAKIGQRANRYRSGDQRSHLICSFL